MTSDSQARLTARRLGGLGTGRAGQLATVDPVLADPPEHPAFGKLEICRHFSDGTTGADLFDPMARNWGAYDRGIFFLL